MASLISGTETAKAIRAELAVQTAELKETLGVVPGLAVILVGERRDSKAYVNSKKKACAEIGITSFGFDYPSDVDQAVIIAKVEELNADPAVNGEKLIAHRTHNYTFPSMLCSTSSTSILM